MTFTTRQINGEPARVNEPMAAALDRVKKAARKPRPRPFVVVRITDNNGEPVLTEFDRRTTVRAACTQAVIQRYLRGGRWGVWDERQQRLVNEID